MKKKGTTYEFILHGAIPIPTCMRFETSFTFHEWERDTSRTALAL